MTEFRISPEDLRRLARLVEENGLSELRYEEGDLRITLRTGGSDRSAAAPSSLAEPLTAPPNGHPALPPPDALPRIPAEPDGAALPENAIRIEAPVMGVFYRRPSPNEPPFAEVGDHVEVGQAVGMIEAMKVFSEVLTENAGIVLDIPARNGALVQPGDTLVILEVLE